jgi:hypothetical protein
VVLVLLVVLPKAAEPPTALPATTVKVAATATASRTEPPLEKRIGDPSGS